MQLHVCYFIEFGISEVHNQSYEVSFIYQEEVVSIKWPKMLFEYTRKYYYFIFLSIFCKKVGNIGTVFIKNRN